MDICKIFSSLQSNQSTNISQVFPPPHAGLMGLMLKRLPEGPPRVPGPWGGLPARDPAVSAHRGGQKPAGLGCWPSGAGAH